MLFLPFVAAALFYSMATGRFVAFTIFLLAVIGCCLLYAFFSLFRIRLELQAPSRVTEGEEIDLALLLRSRGFLPKFVSRSVIEIVDPHTPYSRRGNPKGRHLNLFYQHEQESDADDLKASTYQMDGFILGRGLSRIHRKLELNERGVVTLRRLKIYLTDPLGTFAFRRSFVLNHDILVRVRPALGGGLLQLSGASGRLDTHVKVGEMGEMTEFAGTRPYREGDELRHIHWPTVARTGDLYVREYTQSSADSVVVLLMRQPELDPGRDCRPPSGEFVLKTVAALVIELFNRRVQTFFATNLTDSPGVSIGYSKLALQRFHDELSAVSWRDRPRRLDFLDNVVLPGFDQACILIFCVETPQRDTLQQVSDLLRVSTSRCLVITPDGVDASAVSATGMRTVSCREKDPEALFANLSL